MPPQGVSPGSTEVPTAANGNLSHSAQGLKLKGIQCCAVQVPGSKQVRPHSVPGPSRPTLSVSSCDAREQPSVLKLAMTAAESKGAKVHAAAPTQPARTDRAPFAGTGQVRCTHQSEPKMLVRGAGVAYVRLMYKLAHGICVYDLCI